MQNRQWSITGIVPNSTQRSPKGFERQLHFVWGQVTIPSIPQRAEQIHVSELLGLTHSVTGSVHALLCMDGWMDGWMNG